MAATKLTQNEQVNGTIVQFSANLTVQIICGKVSIAQAVQTVNEFADSLRGKIPDDEVSDVRTYMTDYIFCAQASMQKQNRADNGKSSHKPFSDMTYAELGEWVRHHRDDKEAEEWFFKKRPIPLNIHWRSDPREIGVSKGNFNPEDIPWQERQPWATIKKSLPPAMIDTPEKEEKAAWRIGFLLGYSAEKATMAAIREFGLVGGAATVALFAWAYEQIKRNS